ncbi:MAG: acetoacetate-CoA ligase [Acidimicrobiales bacterium]|nr:MAG: acetoacetate-CoA ligase [Acidimicrobiales bacterium]
MAEPIWRPSPERAEAANLTAFARAVGHEGFETLHAWSVTKPADFWAAAWDRLGVVGDRGERVIDTGDHLTDTRFFPDARLNVAENLLAHRGPQPAMVFHSEDGSIRRTISRDGLRSMVGQLQAAMRRAGVGEGDRVVVWLPNIPETYAVMLAAASIGATFSSTSPDFGVDGVVDRFGQIEPTLLFTCDAYRYGGKVHDRLEPLAEIRAQLPTLEQVVVVPFVGDGGTGDVPDAVTLDAFVDGIDPKEPDFVRLPFDHPWYVLFSSGTTGKPKCIVHRTGGVLLKHLVEHQLHCDIRPGDRVFYFTTAGWMMWNWLASALASGATLVLYDGSPFHPDGNRLFDLADETGITLFGTSAKFIEALGKSSLSPADTHDLAALRTLTSTGSTLVAEGFVTVHERIKADLHLASISGGTDLCGCLVLGDPTSPVLAGEIQRPALGLDIDVADELGNRVSPGVRGELVCRNAFPSMPLGFHDDPGDERYHAAYFERIAGVWHQGDFAEWTEQGGVVIHGRSDATLNPGGVRIGTAEIYRQVDKVPGIVEAIVIGQEVDGDTRVVLFVVLEEGRTLDDDLEAAIRAEVRAGATPRHVPAVIGQVPEIPRTRSGKIVELGVRAVVHGNEVRNTEALANPEALEHFRNHPALAD